VCSKIADAAAGPVPWNRIAIQMTLSHHPTTLHPLSVSFDLLKATDHRVMPETSLPIFAKLKSARRAKLKSQTAPSFPFRERQRYQIRTVGQQILKLILPVFFPGHFQR
jgi:hypothetical protein